MLWFGRWVREVDRNDLLSAVRDVDALVDVAVGPASQKIFLAPVQIPDGGFLTT